eukprot:g3514.t1
MSGKNKDLLKGHSRRVLVGSRDGKHRHFVSWNEDYVVEFCLNLMRDYLERKGGFESCLPDFDAQKTKLKNQYGTGHSVRGWYDVAQRLDLPDLIRSNQNEEGEKQYTTMVEILVRQMIQDKETIAQLRQDMDELEKGLGMNNPMGEIFQRRHQRKRSVSSPLKKKGTRRRSDTADDQGPNEDIFAKFMDEADEWDETENLEETDDSRLKSAVPDRFSLMNIASPSSVEDLLHRQQASIRTENKLRRLKEKEHQRRIRLARDEKMKKKREKNSLPRWGGRSRRTKHMQSTKSLDSLPSPTSSTFHDLDSAFGDTSLSTKDMDGRFGFGGLESTKSLLGNESDNEREEKGEGGSSFKIPPHSNEFWIPNDLRERMWKHDVDNALKNAKHEEFELGRSKTKKQLSKYYKLMEQKKDERSMLALEPDFENTTISEIKVSKERQRVLNHKTRCFLCEKAFPAINLKQKVSIKAVVDLRQSWEAKNVGAARQEANKNKKQSSRERKALRQQRMNLMQFPHCYDSVRICKFCTQFFQKPGNYRLPIKDAVQAQKMWLDDVKA